MGIKDLTHCALQVMALHAVRTQVILKRTGNVNGVLQVNATNCLPWALYGCVQVFLCDCTDLTKPVIYGQALCWVVKQYYRHV